MSNNEELAHLVIIIIVVMELVATKNSIVHNSSINNSCTKIV